MANFKKLGLIATEIYGKTSVETAKTATDPNTIPPAVFQKRAGGNTRSSMTITLSAVIDPNSVLFFYQPGYNCYLKVSGSMVLHHQVLVY